MNFVEDACLNVSFTNHCNNRITFSLHFTPLLALSLCLSLAHSLTSTYAHQPHITAPHRTHRNHNKETFHCDFINITCATFSILQLEQQIFFSTAFNGNYIRFLIKYFAFDGLMAEGIKFIINTVVVRACECVT